MTVARRTVLTAGTVLAAAVAAGAESVPADALRPLLPADLIDLTAWKFTNDRNVQTTDPALLTYTDADYYVRAAVVFRAHCGGVPVPGSKYARAEYREMNPPSGSTPASWSTTTGVHTMTLRQRVTKLPPVKPEVVCGQIHNTDPQVLVTLYGTLLTVRFYQLGFNITLDGNYRTGTWMDLVITASGGYVDVVYNGVPKAHVATDIGGCYFKAGCYVQSNASTGDTAGSFGEVEIVSLVISHT